MSVSQKPDPGSLRYWWNELLFTRYFEYETDNAPEDIAYQIEQLVHKHEGWLWGTTQETTAALHPNGKGLDFDVQRKMRRKLDLIALLTARAQGTAQVDSATGRTKVSGTIKLGRFFHLFLLFVVIYVLVIGSLIAPFVPSAELIAIPILLLFVLAPIFGSYWWRIYRDRNEVAAQVEQAVMEKRKRDTSRLEADMSADNNIEYEDNLPDIRLTSGK